MSASSDLKLLFSPSACHFHFDASDWVNLKKLSVTTFLRDMNQKHWCFLLWFPPQWLPNAQISAAPRKTPLCFLVIALKQHERRGGAKGIKLFEKHTPFEGRFSSLIRKQVEKVEVKCGSWNSNQYWQMAEKKHSLHLKTSTLPLAAPCHPSGSVVRLRYTYRCPSLNAASQNHLSHQSKTDQILLSARCVQQHQVEATTKQKLLMLKKHLVKHLPDNELSKDEVIPEILQ